MIPLWKENRVFDTRVYLRRLGHSAPTEPTCDTLRRLHRSHLLTIPYDNSTFSDDGGALPGNSSDCSTNWASTRWLCRPA
jgi:hypothetical protein